MHVPSLLSPLEQCRHGTGADVAFVIDSSHSIDDEEYVTLNNFIMNLTNALTLGPEFFQVGVVQFSYDGLLKISFNETRSQSEFEEAFARIEHVRGATNIAAGLEVMREQLYSPRHGDRSTFDDVCILITDGRATDRETDTMDEARAAKDAGIFMVTIGITDKVNVDELMDMASESDTFFPVVDFNTLQTILTDVLGVLCIEPTTAEQGDCEHVSSFFMFPFRLHVYFNSLMFDLR